MAEPRGVWWDIYVVTQDRGERSTQRRIAMAHDQRVVRTLCEALPADWELRIHAHTGNYMVVHARGEYLPRNADGPPEGSV